MKFLRWKSLNFKAKLGGHFLNLWGLKRTSSHERFSMGKNGELLRRKSLNFRAKLGDHFLNLRGLKRVAHERFSMGKNGEFLRRKSLNFKAKLAVHFLNLRGLPRISFFGQLRRVFAASRRTQTSSLVPATKCARSSAESALAYSIVSATKGLRSID